MYIYTKDTHAYFATVSEVLRRLNKQEAPLCMVHTMSTYAFVVVKMKTK